MGLFGFGKVLPPKIMVSKDTASKDIVAQYRRLRPIRLRLNDELVSRCSRDVLEEGAKKLGILRGGTFVLDSEDEMSVLMDYCVYDVYRRGRNAIEQYLCDCPPDPDSEEMTCLHAMQHATYALVVVLEVEAGVGCHVRNMFTDETRLLADTGLSKTARHGAVIATRLLDFGDFISTSGAALPLGILDDDDVEAWQRELRTGVHDDRHDPAPLIRELLQRGASSDVRYEGEDTQRRFDVAEGSPPMPHSAQERRALAKSLASKPAENRRCRCGSGKMFKNCCGKS